MTLTEANNKRMWSNETKNSQVMGSVLAIAAISSGIGYIAVEDVQNYNESVRVVFPCPLSCSTNRSVELTAVTMSMEPVVPQHIIKMQLLREKAIKKGMKLFSQDEILEKISRDRGELG